jgi:hypothetical protein
MNWPDKLECNIPLGMKKLLRTNGLAYWNHPQPLISGLYYKHITIINDDSSVISKWLSPLIDDARVVIYDRNVFIIHASADRSLQSLQN